MPGRLANRLKQVTLGVTKNWAKQRKAEERHASAEANRRARLTRVRDDYWNFRSASFHVMERAYLAASANGTLPASARQVMYQARPLVQQMVDRPLDDQYFCQTLLPDYIEESGVDWDITYDDRGHFIEPHTKCKIGLGTISVRNYLARLTEPNLTDPDFAPGGVKTHGPDGCFGAVLFTEKEGFFPLFEAVNLAEKYDLAIMSTKGMSVTAARQLADKMCGPRGISVLVLHDFDKAGLSILATLRDNTRRYTYRHKIKIVDLGLRLPHVEEFDLQSEDAFDKGATFSRRMNLRKNGATDEEIEFLLEERVELNAMTSDQLVNFIKRELEQHGIKKIVPDEAVLAETYRLASRNDKIKKIVARAVKELNGKDTEPPFGLAEQVAEYLEDNPKARWDEAVKVIHGRLTAPADSGLEKGDHKSSDLRPNP